MNRKVSFLVIAVLIATIAVPVFADPQMSAAPYRTFPRHLYLYEKDESWNIVEGGAIGKLNVAKGVFNGHRLEANTAYSLVSYVDPWGSQNTVLASGMSDAEGNIHLRGATGATGKVWLVLDSDIDGDGYMTGWQPTEYLFEYAVLP